MNPDADGPTAEELHETALAGIRFMADAPMQARIQEMLAAQEASIERSRQEASRCAADARAAAAQLLDASQLTLNRSGEPYYDALRWLAEVARERGYQTEYRPRATTARVKPPAAELITGGGWPSAKHLRLHYLAQRDGGWDCQDCGVALVDACSDQDVTCDGAGKRMLRPDCGKRMPTLDHIIPQDLGGSDEPPNLRLVCGPCNSRKGAS